MYRYEMLFTLRICKKDVELLLEASKNRILENHYFPQINQYSTRAWNN